MPETNNIQADFEATVADYEQHPEEYSVIAKHDIKSSYIIYLSGEENYIESLNGARIRDDLSVRIRCEVFKEDLPNGEENFLGYSIEVNSDMFLGDIFQSIPYGIIKKNRTGVGATSLELSSPRNSIIVVPTKKLAFSKALKGIDPETKKCAYLYVGSKVSGDEQFPTLEEYINDEVISFKKILVVADSLWKVIEAIQEKGDNVYEDYFLMVDEVDTYQSDSIFRPALERVMDYYFAFDKSQRCLVSATIREFSNPEINKEPTINITYTESFSRKISLVHTNNPNQIVKENIEYLFSQNPTEKIVVAYNKVMFIRQIIQNLSDECRAECAILCGENSEEHAGEYHDELCGDVLPKRITFMTNPFFAGIDIEERFHLISVSNVELLYTLMSPDKLQQIAGRSRHEEGLYSETIVYNTKPYEGDLSAESYRGYLLNFAEDISNYIKQATYIMYKYNNYNIIDDTFLNLGKDIQKRAERYYYKGTKMSVIRDNKLTKEYVPAYFNIDSLYDTQKLHIELYTAPQFLCEVLSRNNEIVLHDTQNREYSEEQRNNDLIVEEEYDRIENEGLEGVITLIEGHAAFGRLNERTLSQIITNCRSRGKARKFAECFQRLYRYIPAERLISDLRDKFDHAAKFRSYNNSTILWALPEEHLFKIDLKAKFPEESVLTKEIIIERMQALYSTHFHTNLPENICVQVLGEFIEHSRVDTRTTDRIIIRYNKFDLPNEPLIRITLSENLKDLLKFRGES